MSSAAHDAGVARGGDALPHAEHGILVSPLEGRSRVWWRYEVEERRSGGRGGDYWVTIDKGESKTPFVVDDDTGSCLVHPSGAATRIDMNRTWYGSSVRPVVGAAGGSMLGPYRYHESIILAGEKLYALGRFAMSQQDAVGGAVHTLDEPSDGSPFLLSTQSQQHLTAYLRSGASNAFKVFVASGAGLAWLLAMRGIF